jgi:hypothetical protein
MRSRLDTRLRLSLQMLWRLAHPSIQSGLSKGRSWAFEDGIRTHGSISEASVGIDPQNFCNREHGRDVVGNVSLPNNRSHEAGVSLVELSVALFLLTAVAVFGFQTMMSGWMLQNSSIMQSMTDAYAGIETAYAQRWTFANIPASGRWPIYPQSNSTTVTIGKTPKGPVNATVVRTSHQYTDPLTLAQSYMLESYVVYKDELRQYCKVSKVYRTE